LRRIELFAAEQMGTEHMESLISNLGKFIELFRKGENQNG